MQLWRASITYGPGTAEWGIPEELFESLLTRFGVKIEGVDAGTDLTTGERDYACYFRADPAQM